LAARTETEKRLHRLLKHDLGKAVSRTRRGTWTTTSNLPHEIRLHTQAGVELVRISAGIVIDTEPSKKLFVEMNRLNAERAFSRRILIDGKILVVAEMPVASLQEGDLENLVSMVCCFARLDAEALAEYGGRPVTDPPAALDPKFDTPFNNWWDVLRASGTATARELAVWPRRPHRMRLLDRPGRRQRDRGHQRNRDRQCVPVHPRGPAPSGDRRRGRP